MLADYLRTRAPRTTTARPAAHGSERDGRSNDVEIAIIGLGYVGAVTAACLADLGRVAIGVDQDQVKCDAIAAGRGPIAEPGLDDLLAAGVRAGRIHVTDMATAVGRADVIMISVGTPSAASGALDLTAVLRVAEEIGAALQRDGRFRTIVMRSTVLPGTTEERVKPAIERASGMRAGEDFGLAMNPEFLREGSSIRDFYEASRTIVGAHDARSAEQVTAAYEGLAAPIEVVSIRTAEMVKYTDNAFHATKIAFANEIASFARAHGVDGREAMRLMMADDRLNISTAYLRPGYAFGGSCLPKDLRAITDRARKSDLELPLLNATLQSNTAHFERGVRLVEAAGGRNVALLGLSFKASTDDLRESPAVALAERLIGRGYRLAIYDPDVVPQSLRGANKAFIDEHLPHLAELLQARLEDAIGAADTLVVTKRWDGLDELERMIRPDQCIVDLVGLDDDAGTMARERYVGIGW
jgi:GDP-mannose 6-dehydrogenase